MANRNERRTHSGHIKATNVTGANALLIVRDVGVLTAYRIYNTGDSTFIVQPDSQPTIELQKKSSTDVAVNQQIRITQSAAALIEGIYERIDAAEDKRGGRFRGDASGGAVIARNRGEVIYRILNSGRRNFSVNGITPALEQKLSLDVVAGTAITLSRGDANQIEAIYEYLPNINSRAGRFKILLDMADKHSIINLTGSTRTVYYRILNSGDEDFQFLLSTAASGQRVRPEQSFDFAVAGNTIMCVSPMADNKRIQGIYEYLGP